MSDAAEPKEVSTVKPSMLSFFRQKYVIEKALWDLYQITDEKGKYAERLVAEALGAKIMANGTERGHDLVHPIYKRIEVKSRKKPLGIRKENRATLNDKKRHHFEHFVHVSFGSDYTVVGAYILPHDTAFKLHDSTTSHHFQFNKGAAMGDATDITAQVIAAQTRL